MTRGEETTDVHALVPHKANPERALKPMQTQRLRGGPQFLYCCVYSNTMPEDTKLLLAPTWSNSRACASVPHREIQRLPFSILLRLGIPACFLLCGLTVATTMAGAQSASESLPDAPGIEKTVPARQPLNPLSPSAAPWLFNPQLNIAKPLTVQQKFQVYTHQSFGPPQFIAPAFGAAIRMANPPSDYPREWKDGGGAFARLYGSSLATQTAKHTVEFATEAAFHYDARYVRSNDVGAWPRIGHAFEYVVLQKTDSGRTSFALPHFTGALTGGFIGMAYLPPGYDTASKAGTRAATELLSTAARNLAFEFAPELAPFERKLHLPKVVPVWWSTLHRDPANRP